MSYPLQTLLTELEECVQPHVISYADGELLVETAQQEVLRQEIHERFQVVLDDQIVDLYRLVEAWLKVGENPETPLVSEMVDTHRCELHFILECIEARLVENGQWLDLLSGAEPLQVGPIFDPTWLSCINHATLEPAM